jgi:protein TonB
MAREAGIQGKVYVKFVVKKDGTIGEVKVVRGVHKTLDREAIRAVKSMPKWTAGEQRGKKVSVWFTLPVNFRIG